MTRALIAFILWFGLIGGATAATNGQPAKDPTSAIQLLANASQAVRHESYRGVLVYLRHGQLDTLKVVHRFHNHHEQERLLSLTGPPREVIRDGNQVTSILPSHKLVLISQHAPKSLLGSVTRFSTKQLRAHYKVVDKGTERFAGRSCRVISIQPRDRYRYGYRMLIDQQKQLPLKLELRQGNKVLEQLIFTEISFPKSIPGKDFLATYDVSGFRVVKHEAIHVQDQASVPEDDWKAKDLPPGFELAEDGVRQVTKHGFVRQMLFTDGVATVSAFIAPAGLRAPLKGATRMGAVNAYGDVVGDMQITVVGEVPAVTARKIAQNLIRTKPKTKSTTEASK
ncbi:MAG: MucB/RseB C-terminal domain-containing protein [Salinisphaera sp.]|nr:MucB/RseB C-terminal domain-containing protein [Salinisphaera sp.]